MKNTILLIGILSLIISSCSEVHESQGDLEIKPGSEEQLQAEGTGVKTDHRYDDISTETTFSDCYIVSHFTDMDINFITVDFVNYKVIETDSEPEYELVNEIKTLRTFVVNDDYLTCGRNKSKTLKELLDIYQKDPKTIFSIETTDGLAIELYVDTCSG